MGPFICPARESIQLLGMCGQLPFSANEDFHGGITTPGRGWRALKQCIKEEEQARTSTLNSSDITDTDPETWPAAHTINNTGHGYFFFFFCQPNSLGSTPNS